MEPAAIRSRERSLERDVEAARLGDLARQIKVLAKLKQNSGNGVNMARKDCLPTVANGMAWSITQKVASARKTCFSISNPFIFLTKSCMDLCLSSFLKIGFLGPFKFRRS